MSQDAYRSLLIETMDTIAFIKHRQAFLKIALEKLNSPDDETIEVTELLISQFLEDFDYFLERVQNLETKRVKFMSKHKD